MPIGECFPECDAFRADSQSIGRILDVTSMDDLTRAGQQGRTDSKIRKVGNRKPTSLRSSLNQKIIDV
ncbi:unnamed protein product [Tuwongella immobilis]|uniref:Uncharacterized protein n=1 Tax=Tuwongella immobilis TaxID=692036 RepID=A0A6C2YQ10_9BACT|nr:unnamed protein product [Tuwongella immobilis]VTS04174.1 unnamed protein product [Tuwongella immobilis]